MARTIGTLCTLVVCLQILVGVPIVVCLGCLLIAGNLGPVSIQVHTGHDHAALIAPPAYSLPDSGTVTIAPPPNIIPHPTPLSPDNPVLASRAEHGSPLAGTVLSEQVSREDEQQMFIAALEKVAADQVERPVAEIAAAKPHVSETVGSNSSPQDAARYAIDRLYEIAEVDERAGEYSRADQWRALARDLAGQRD